MVETRFRIEFFNVFFFFFQFMFLQGIKKGDGTSSKDFKTTKSREQILTAFNDFTYGFPHVMVSFH